MNSLAPQPTAGLFPGFSALQVVWNRALARNLHLLHLAGEVAEFSPGQHMALQFPGSLELRDYTPASSPQPGGLELLVEVRSRFSRALGACGPGAVLGLGPAHGSFLAGAHEADQQLFLAEAAGLAPFCSWLRLHPRTGASHSILVHIQQPGLDLSVVLGPEVLAALGGWVQVSSLEEVPWAGLEQILGQGPRVQVCGSGVFAQGCLELLESKGIEPWQVDHAIFQ